MLRQLSVFYCRNAGHFVDFLLLVWLEPLHHFYSPHHCCCCGVVFVVNPKLKAKNFSNENLSQNNLSHGHLISDSTGDPGPAPPQGPPTAPYLSWRAWILLLVGGAGHSSCHEYWMVIEWTTVNNSVNCREFYVVVKCREFDVVVKC